MSLISVNGSDVTSGLAFTAPAGATDVSVIVTTADADATYVVSGKTGLSAGPNDVTVTVTAANETSTRQYVVVVTVPVTSTDNTLASITVDGDSVEVDGTVNKDYGTQSVEVVATATSNKATVVVSGNTDLNSGSNTVTVTVTAESGAVATYTFNVQVAKSSNTNVSAIYVNTVDVSNSLTFTAPLDSTDVSVTVVTEDADATYVVSGETGLSAGPNNVTVTVTAADESSTRQYVVVVTVPSLSADNGLASITVDGEVVEVNGTVNKDYGTESVEVVATPTSGKASARVTGATGLNPGSNTVNVIVTAENGVEAGYSFTVSVAYSSDSSLASITANGASVDVDGSIDVEPGTSSVTVVALATDVSATVEVTGNTVLTTGPNTVNVKVIAGNGTFTNYSFTVNVLALSANKDLSSLTINGQDALASSTINVDNSITEAVVAFETASAAASALVISSTTLDVGNNTIQVRVTAENGDTQVYSVTVVRAEPLSGNTNIGSITVNGDACMNSCIFEVAYGVTSVEVVAIAEDEGATTEVLDTTGLTSGDNTVTVIVTAANGDTASYTFTIRVAKSNVATATAITVNGTSVSLTAGSYTVGSDTTSVSVVATPTDVDATYTVSGADDLDYGDNNVVVTITAADLVTTNQYVVNVYRTPLSTNTDIGTITVNGNIVAVDGNVEVVPGTTSVSVVATAADAGAGVEVSGNTELDPGSNTVTVTITAPSGATASYTFTVFVNSLSSDSTLKTFTIDGTETENDATVTLDGTKNYVSVVALANDSAADVVITGTTGLAYGSNEVKVVVTAEDGSTSTYTVNVVFPNIHDASLAVFTVDGETVADGQTVNLESGVTEVVVVATATDPGADVQVEGGTDLVPGENTLTVTVTALDGETVETYTVTLLVAFSVNTNITSFQVNGEDVVDGGTFDLEPYTLSAEVTVETEDPDATYVVSGAEDLVAGENLVTVTVTAADKVTTLDYTVTLIVALGNDVTFSSFQINGEDVEDGGEFTTAPLTDSVEVTFETTDVEASYVVAGDTDLVVGTNILTVTVTAADRSTSFVYSVTVIVPLNNDASLAVFTVNDVAVADGDSVALEYGTTEVDLVATATDSDADVNVVGGTDLQPGENELVVTVTAADGETTATYTVTLVVALNDDASLAVFTVNEVDVADGDAVDLEYGVTEVTVVVETTDPDADFEVTGGTELVSGENELVVTVTAADGETTATYTVILNVALNSDTSLATFTVNGVAVEDTDVIELDPYTTEVEIVAEGTDPDAIVDVVGGTELVAGENLVTVTVTAQDGTVAEYSIILNVALGNNVELSTFTVNGNDVAGGDVVDLEPYSTSVEVVVETVDPEASYEIAGGTDLVVGANTLTVTVTAADGSTSVNYVVTLNLPAGNNVELSSFQVNGVDVADGDSVALEYGTTEVDLVATATDSDADVNVVGGTDLQPGENELVVTVTAADGETTATYTVTLVVALNDDASLAVFTVNEVDVADGDAVDLEYGVTEVTVVVETTDPDADFEVTGGTELVSGENELVVTVTAADGETTATYTVILNVALNSDTSLATFTVNGVAVEDTDVIELDPYTTEVEIVAEGTDPDAIVDVVGGTELVAGENLVTVTVTAQDGTVAEYSIILNVALGNDVTFASFQVNGEDVEDGGSVTVEPLTTSVEVAFETTDPEASYEVSGDTGLEVGENVLTVTVTAADGSTSVVYTVTVVVPLNNDASLSLLTVNGVEVADGDSVALEYGTTEAEIVATPTDSEATVDVVGGTDLQPGENVVTITVTAADLETIETVTITLVVALNFDTSLLDFTVNGDSVSDGDTYVLDPYTTSVVVFVETSDPGATFEIAGGTDLETGDNELVVTVTAADGETVQEYRVNLYVTPSSDTSLSVFTIGGVAVEDGSDLELPVNTTEVEVIATPNDENANVDVVGADALVGGDNVIEVTVTAADGETVQVYRVNVFVLLSTETGVTEILVGGEAALDGDVILTTDLEVTEVDVEVTTKDENATFEVTGNTELVLGDNVITITVTAPNGDTREYTVTYRIGGLPGNAKLKSLVVGGSSIDLTATEPTVTLPAGAKFASVIAATEDEAATFKVEGNKNLVEGNNTVTITVAAADGKTVRVYTVKVVVNSLSSNTGLSLIYLNGFSVLANSNTTVAAGSRYVEVIAQASDAATANVSYSGNTNLVEGNNDVVIRVTAQNGDFAEYHINVIVPTLSTDTSLKSFTIEGFDMRGKSKLNVIPGTTKLHISAQANDAGASVSITGRDIVAGVNTVTVTVTAADGTSQTYIVKVKA